MAQKRKIGSVCTDSGAIEEEANDTVTVQPAPRRPRTPIEVVGDKFATVKVLAENAADMSLTFLHQFPFMTKTAFPMFGHIMGEMARPEKLQPNDLSNAMRAAIALAPFDDTCAILRQKYDELSGAELVAVTADPSSAASVISSWITQIAQTPLASTLDVSLVLKNVLRICRVLPNHADARATLVHCLTMIAHRKPLDGSKRDHVNFDDVLAHLSPIAVVVATKMSALPKAAKFIAERCGPATATDAVIAACAAADTEESAQEMAAVVAGHGRPADLTGPAVDIFKGGWTSVLELLWADDRMTGRPDDCICLCLRNGNPDTVKWFLERYGRVLSEGCRLVDRVPGTVLKLLAPGSTVDIRTIVAALRSAYKEEVDDASVFKACMALFKAVVSQHPGGVARAMSMMDDMPRLHTRSNARRIIASGIEWLYDCLVWAPPIA